MGQKDDTRENSCVTESKKEIETGKMREKGRREGRRVGGWMKGKKGEKEMKRAYGSVTTSQKAKSHTISIF